MVKLNTRGIIPLQGCQPHFSQVVVFLFTIMAKDYFTFYRSYYESLQDLGKEDRLVIYESIMNYMFNDIEPTLEGIPKIIYGLIRPTLLKSKKLSENGKKGGGQLGNQNAKKNKD